MKAMGLAPCGRAAQLLRLPGPAMALGAVLVIVTVSFGRGIGPLYLLGVALLVVGVGGQLLRGGLQRPRQERGPVLIAPPVAGRWRGLNSPATKVPSHMHGLAQTFALDITHEPQGAPPRRMDALWPPMRRPGEFPSFGRPVLAPFDGVVVATRGSARDHLTRLSLPGLFYLFVEGFVRSLGTPRHLLGNHVFVRADGEEAVVAVLAHLRRGSLRVAPGERVVAGQQLGECGNSGNSSDPHVHVQLMDGEDIVTAHGVPFAWDYRTDAGQERRGVPADGELFVVEG